MSTETADATKAQQKWQPPPEGTPCWVEIPAQDINRLKSGVLASYWIPLTILAGKAFYGAIFPSWEWSPEHGESTEGQSKVQQYTFAELKGLSGGIIQMPEGCAPTEQIMGSGMTVYYMVDSLETMEKKIHKRGGSTCLGKTAESSHGWFMNFRDPEGNRFGCYEMRRS